MLLALLSAVSFSTLGIFVKLIYAEGFSPFQALAWRFTGASVLLWAWMGISGRGRPSLRESLPVLFLGLFGFAPQAGLYFATLRYLDAGITSLLLYLYPSFVVLFTSVSRRRKPSAVQAAAMALSLAGCVVIFFQAGKYPAAGIAIGVLTALSYAAYLVVGERVLEARSPVHSTAVIMTAAALVYWALTAAAGAFKSPEALPSFLALAGISLVATVIPVVALFGAMQRIGASNTALVSTVEPLAAVLLSALLLGERFGPQQLAGGALIVAAVLLIQAGRIVL
ncbi:MAG TPA: DMT family transporter [Magnetospirillaceae bacterium]|nr:DMT family transporter [Magnetospirillaceae bacterium]